MTHFQTLRHDPRMSLSVCDNLLIVRFHEISTDHGRQLIRNAFINRVASTNKQVGIIFVTATASKTTGGPRSQAYLRQALAEAADHLAGCAVVIEGHGPRAVVRRMIASTIALAAGGRHTKLFDSTNAAASWLQPRLAAARAIAELTLESINAECDRIASPPPRNATQRDKVTNAVDVAASGLT